MERLPRPLTVRIDPRELGAALAHLDDSEQAAFLTEFCRELRAVAGTNFNAGICLRAVNESISALARLRMELINELRTEREEVA